MKTFSDRNTRRSFAQIFTVKSERRIDLTRCVFFVLLMIAFSGTLLRAADGDLDPTFGSGGKQTIQIAADVRDYVTAIAIQPDGKIVLGGEVGDFFGPNNGAVLVRLDKDGSLDPTFGSGGKVVNQNQAHLPALAIQPDGKIVTAAIIRSGFISQFGAVRYNPDGSLDQTFGAGGVALNGTGESNALILQPDGKIVVIGTFPIFRNGSDFLLARFNADGTPDQSFGSGGRLTTSFTSGRQSSDQAFAGALQSDGKIVVSGAVTGIPATLIRYNSDGSVDWSFGLDGTVLTPNFGAATSRMVIQPDDKILVGGGAFVLGRYDRDGHTDHNFGNNGRSAGGFGSGNGALYGIELQPDGKVLVAGSIYFTGNANAVFTVGRYNSNGILDQTFGSGGFVTTDFTDALDEAFALSLQPSGKFILAGYAAEPGASYHDMAVARYLTTKKTSRRP